MIKIVFSPQLRIPTPALLVAIEGGVLTVNGEHYDIEAIEAAAVIGPQFFDYPYLVGASHLDDTLQLTILLPHGIRPAQTVAFPQPVLTNGDGTIPVPQ